MLCLGYEINVLTGMYQWIHVLMSLPIQMDDLIGLRSMHSGSEVGCFMIHDDKLYMFFSRGLVDIETNLKRMLRAGM